MDELDNKLLLKIGKALGAAFEDVAVELKITTAEIDNIKMSNPHNASQWGFKTLLTWKQRQPRSVNKREVLARALGEVGRDDLAELVDGNSSRDNAGVIQKTNVHVHVVRQATEDETSKPYSAVTGVQPSASDTEEDTDSDQDNDDNEDLHVHDSTREFFEKWRSHDDVYSNYSQPRGRCFIINNYKFEPKMRNRDGTEHDLQRLKQLFKKFRYTVDVKTDLTAGEIREVLKEESNHRMHMMYESFVLVILSHGTVDAVYGVDKETVPYNEIYNFFNGENCKSLAEKPKIIIIQACQGKKKDEGVVSSANKDNKTGDDVDASSPISSSLSDPTPLDEVDSPDGTQKSPTMAHFFIGTATTQDYVSWRNTNTGTWFIQALVHIFRKYACKMDISDMFRKINKVVGSNTSMCGKKQMSEFRSRLTKKFYFFPGQ